LRLHDHILYHLGGEAGILNLGLVDSAAQRPQSVVYGKEIFTGCVIKAASLACALISWHPFVDGNKRTALYSMAIMLDMNGIYMPFPPYLVKYSLLVAREKMTESEFAQKIAWRCARKGSLMQFYKELRYDRIPKWELNFLLKRRFTRRRAIDKMVDWLAAGYYETLQKTMEDYHNRPRPVEKDTFRFDDDDMFSDAYGEAPQKA
ncbi:MAG: type II toxin-antitoxin system death-on-curing family toxin, partial [Rhabdochlamydiaceae bacterium]